jgi:hypothetical protein
MAMIEKRKDGAMMIEVTVDTGTDLSLSWIKIRVQLVKMIHALRHGVLEGNSPTDCIGCP